MTDNSNAKVMDERLKESVSALMDDEANELELQRVLSQADEDELRQVWQRYHLVRDVLQGRENSSLAPNEPSMDIDVSASVAAAIAEEEMQAPSNTSAGPSGWRWFSAGAAAASLLLAVVFVGQQTPIEPVAELAHNAPVQSEEQLSVFRVADNTRQPKMIANLNDEQLQRFNEYLLRHAEHRLVQPGQGMLPLARVASVNAVGI